jgi:selenocysteine lyase/cysteine desulfurase
MDTIAAHWRALRAPLARAAEAGLVSLASPTDGVHESAIVCVKTPDIAESFRALRRAGVVCVKREGSIRLSPHCYNTLQEIDHVLGVLSQT